MGRNSISGQFLHFFHDRRLQNWSRYLLRYSLRRNGTRLSGYRMSTAGLSRRFQHDDGSGPLGSAVSISRPGQSSLRGDGVARARYRSLLRRLGSQHRHGSVGHRSGQSGGKGRNRLRGNRLGKTEKHKKPSSHHETTEKRDVSSRSHVTRTKTDDENLAWAAGEYFL